MSANEGPQRLVVWSTRSPGHVKGLPSQERALVRALERIDLSPRAKAVLRVLCEMTDGAGFCWPAIATLVRRSGYSRPTVFRALDELQSGDAPLVEVYASLRDSTKARPNLSRQAQMGQGTNIYRLGSRLRVAADLRHVDVVEHLGLVRKGVSKASHKGVSPLAEGVSQVVSETPFRDPLDLDVAPVTQGISSGISETPTTNNGKHLTEGAGCTQDLNQGTREAQRRRTLDFADALPATERDLVVELVERLDAVLVEDLAA